MDLLLHEIRRIIVHFLRCDNSTVVIFFLSHYLLEMHTEVFMDEMMSGNCFKILQPTPYLPKKCVCVVRQRKQE